MSWRRMWTVVGVGALALTVSMGDASAQVERLSPAQDGIVLHQGSFIVTQGDIGQSQLLPNLGLEGIVRGVRHGCLVGGGRCLIVSAST